MEIAHTKTREEILECFGTDPERGLSPTQVRNLQEKYGPN
ncbi:Calcium-transporting ATPase sarcoplasmic/endoplasmic reticulum type, partial [Stegodyphus mimosarum]